jgi:hypothetical protein
MDRSTALAICQERLGMWSELLAVDLATPVALLGVKHPDGGLVVCYLDETPIPALRAFLEAALRALPANGSKP